MSPQPSAPPPSLTFRERFGRWWAETFPAPPPPSPPPPDEDASKWADRIGKVAAGLTTGIGAAAVIAFTGGAIHWARFEQAGLPADQAVAAIPRQELIVVGAVSLVGFFVIAAIVVFFTYLVSPHARPSVKLGVWFGALAVIGALWAKLFEDTSHWAPVAILGLGLALGGLLVAVSARTGNHFRWVGAGLFLSVAIVGSAIAYAINFHNPQVQPAAAVRGPDDIGITGIYVAVNDKHLVLGTTKQFTYFRPSRGDVPADPDAPTPASIVKLPCSDVTIAAVGRFRGRRGLAATATELLDLILWLRTRGGVTSTTTPPTSGGTEPKPTTRTGRQRPRPTARTPLAVAKARVAAAKARTEAAKAEVEAAKAKAELAKGIKTLC